MVEEDRKQTKKKSGFVSKTTIVILIILLIFCYWNGQDNLDYYSSCVDGCVSDNSMCMFFASDLSEYILYDDYDECYNDLEICILDCED
jgi:hypothetical protein